MTKTFTSSTRHLADRTLDATTDLTTMAAAELIWLASQHLLIRDPLNPEYPIPRDPTDTRTLLLLGALETLTVCPYYSVTTEMLEVVAMGASQLLELQTDPATTPEDQTNSRLDLDWLPSPNGFVFFDQPIDVKESIQEPNPDGTPSGIISPVEREPVIAAMWDLASDPDKNPGVSLALFPKLAPQADFYWQKWQEGIDSTTTLQLFFIALWSLMSEVTPTPTPATRPARKRAERKGHASRKDTPISIIALRRQTHPTPTTTASGDTEHEPIEHDHRWWVSGHWKNQAHGPGLSLRKRIWINPYIAGPEDKPLKAPHQTVRVLKR